MQFQFSVLAKKFCTGSRLIAIFCVFGACTIHIDCLCASYLRDLYSFRQLFNLCLISLAIKNFADRLPSTETRMRNTKKRIKNNLIPCSRFLFLPFVADHWRKCVGVGARKLLKLRLNAIFIIIVFVRKVVVSCALRKRHILSINVCTTNGVWLFVWRARGIFMYYLPLTVQTVCVTISKIANRLV